METKRQSPPEYEDLPSYVREFLDDLREEEVDQLREAIVFMNTVRITGRFLKWMIITIVGAFLGAAGLGDAFIKVMSWVSVK